MTDIAIRPLTHGDEAEWRKLWKAYLAFYDTELPEQIYRSSFDRMTGPDAREFRGVLACIDGRPMGLAHYLFHRHGWKIEDTCYLQDLYVDPSARGTGLGRKLIEAVYAAADASGAGSVYWLTQDFNATARQLYDRIGAKTPFIVYRR
jgi:GNAT superfamily N-acetyltransferase